MKILFKQLKLTKEETLYRKTRLDQIRRETIDEVQQFYQRDDISRIAPGKRYVVTVRSDQGKVWLQKRHLYMSLKETHSLFQEDHPEIKIKICPTSHDTHAKTLPLKYLVLLILQVILTY